MDRAESVAEELMCEIGQCASVSQSGRLAVRPRVAESVGRDQQRGDERCAQQEKAHSQRGRAPLAGVSFRALRMEFRQR